MKLRLMAAFFIVSSPLMAASGKELFTSLKCIQCHGIKSQALVAEKSGMGEDLSTSGTKHTAEFIQKFLNKEVEFNGKKHLRKPAASEEELKILADWLVTLK